MGWWDCESGKFVGMGFYATQGVIPGSIFMGYIQDLRKHIGSRPILLVGAAVLVIDEQGRLLMNLRPDNHQWGIPGGATELGESVEETAIRETREETGLELGELNMFGVFSGPQFFYRYPNGDEVHNVSVVFVCRKYQGRLAEKNEESLRLCFFAKNEIRLEQISPPVRPVIQKWLEEKGRAE